MYGLINKAVEDLVRSKFGNDAWHRIRAKAGLPDEPFVSMEKYPDQSTYDLVGAASAELGAPAEAVLEEFGRFWTVYTATGTFGEILKSVGRTLPEFLRNLDQMHTRIKLSFPNLEPPSFAVRNETADSLDLHYYSDRPGLAPIVVGMLKGLSDRFMVDLTIVCAREQGDRPHDVFHLKWAPRP